MKTAAVGTIRTAFTPPETLVSLAGAMEYTRDALAGVDNLLIKLADGLPPNLTDRRRARCRSTREI